MQSVLSTVFEVQPDSKDMLVARIVQLRQDEESLVDPQGEKYGRLKVRVPLLHFMALSVFEDDRYDPILVIETNFDGPPGPFWAQLEAAVGEDLRAILRFCERPSGPTGALFDRVVAAGSRQPIASLLEGHSFQPLIVHIGNRGLDRDRILREAELFHAARTILADADRTAPNPYRSATSATAIHAGLRGALLESFPWLDEPAPARIPADENRSDWLRLGGFLALLLLVLSLPGVLLGLMLRPWWVAVLLSLVAAAAFAASIRDLGDLLRFFGAPDGAAPADARPRPTAGSRLVTALKGLAGVVAMIGVYLAIPSAAAAAAVAPLTGAGFGDIFRASAQVLGAGLASMPASALAILWWLRRLEARDASHDHPRLDEGKLRAMMEREDHIAQNHMGSLVLVKPGVLRAVLLRVGLRGLGLVLRVTEWARRGYLGSMRTIHFAHWALIDNGGRLMFFSNFDGSWESYLDDFIEKAHSGLTLAWGNATGFPPARFLLLDGATQGRKFKAWARHSMTVSLFWYSAYKDYTVDQIERHARVADGLRRRSLTNEEGALWARDL
ncbi:hypothetical protein D3869_10890 [Azospirillum brasilense]|uniref:Uncharacterized protein n=1 Tax=Azospirillum brasilense TaxID=192 RepID=A0A4D8REG4_AZOBR|nr:hypothetical protein [Azospirillum brasilense]QCO15692.1 hypothetical protein D3869_10890 [Azospirillum brasilense]